jgi:hypothetical protein
VQAVFKKLEDVATGVVEGKLEECCIKAEELVASLPVDTFVQDCIREALQVNWDEDFESEHI